MVFYQRMQFSQEETRNSFLARYPCGNGGEKEVWRPANHCSLLCDKASESLRGWHAKQVWSTTEKAALFLSHCSGFSLNVLRQEDEVWLKFPCMVPRGSRREVSAGPKLGSPGGVPRVRPQSCGRLREEEHRHVCFCKMPQVALFLEVA